MKILDQLTDNIKNNVWAWIIFLCFCLAESGNIQTENDLQELCGLSKGHVIAVQGKIDEICLNHEPDEDDTKNAPQ